MAKVGGQVASWSGLWRKIVGLGFDGQPAEAVAHATFTQKMAMANRAKADDSKIIGIEGLPALRTAYLPTGGEIRHAAPINSSSWQRDWRATRHAGRIVPEAPADATRDGQQRRRLGDH